VITLPKNCLFPRENDLYPLSPFSTLEPPKSLERDSEGTRRVIRVIRGISINIYIFTIYIVILFRDFSTYTIRTTLTADDFNLVLHPLMEAEA